MSAGQAAHQLTRLAGLGELAELAADGGDLRGPVKGEDPPEVGRDYPGGSLGAGFA